MNLKRGIKVLLPVLALVLMGCAAKARLVDEDVGFYPVGMIKFDPILIKDSQYALVVEYTPDRMSPKTSESSNVIDIIDLRSLSTPKLFSKLDLAEYTEVINDIKASKDGARLYVSTPDSLMVFDIKQLEDIKLLEEKQIHRAGDMVLTPDNRYLYVSGIPENRRPRGTERILLYEIKEKLIFLKNFDTGESHGFSISPDGNKIAFELDMHNGLVVADISNPLAFNILGSDSDTYNNRGEIDVDGSIHDIAFSPDSKKLYIAGGAAGLLVYDLSQNRLKKIQQTRHFYSEYVVFHQTDRVNSVEILGDQIYLTGGSDEVRKDLPFIEGFDKAFLFQGGRLGLSSDGSFLVYTNFRVKPRTLIVKKLSKQTR